MRVQRYAPGLPYLPLAFAMLLSGCQEMPVGPDLSPPSSPDMAVAFAAAAVQVHGGGLANVTDENGDVYGARVALSGVLTPKGKASGSVNLVFGPEFSAVWGAVPGVHAIHVRGKVTSITLDNGIVTLAGTAAVETDVAPGSGVVFFRNEPFVLVLHGPRHFTFQWCLLPAFEVELITGTIASAAPSTAVSTAPSAALGLAVDGLANPLLPRGCAS